MAFDSTAVIKQIDDVLSRCTLRSPSGYDDLSDLPDDKLSESLTMLFSAIERLAPPGSSYLKNAQQYEKRLTGNLGLAVSPLLGILRALRNDYQCGYLQSVQELIHADVFADFLEMSDYLLDQNYKDPAAVLVGSVLEEHLRKLCLKSGLEVIATNGAPKKADALNADLTNAGIYTKLDLKSVTAWLDLRNKAAHGHYADYTKEQVGFMLQGVRDFISRHAA
jgi:hypothetical protein